MSTTTASASVSAAAHRRAARTGTGRASWRQLLSVPELVNAMTAARPSLPISVGSAISVSFSPPSSLASAMIATTGMSSLLAATAVSTACSVAWPAA
jgi:hypothetical protein